MLNDSITKYNGMINRRMNVQKSKSQKSVALSPSAAKLVAASEHAKEVKMCVNCVNPWKLI